MLKITVAQPPYFAGETPDSVVAEFLKEQLLTAEKGSLIVLPEYSNAGGLSDPEKEKAALPRAEEMIMFAQKTAKEKECYVAINVLQQRGEDIKNSTYLFDKQGEVAFVYDKIHLPPSEVALGVTMGDGSCVCDLDGIRFAFLTCYDIYFNEQIEFIAKHKPDVIIFPGYQRGEHVDILRAQLMLTAFRTNAYVARSSFSMNDDFHGGCSAIVAPDGKILKDMGKEIGQISVEVDLSFKHTRPAGFGCGIVRNDDFINNGLCPEVFNK